MSLAAVACQCGSVGSLIRNCLKRNGYEDWLKVPIPQGREKSLLALERLPNTPERDMLKNFLKNSSKWAVIIGYSDTEMKWSDIAHNATRSNIEAEYIIRNFGFD